jgi:hypothetical protein
MVELRCGGRREAPFLLAGGEITLVRHEEPLVCGKVRRSLGCVIAKAIEPSSLAARNGARDAARAERDLRKAEDEAKTCPAGCEVNPVMQVGDRSRLVISRQVKQADRVWVAYWVASWWVEHKCVPLKEPKAPKERRYDR